MIRQKFPPLSTLIVFESAARLQSFKLASEELNITQSAISHQITSLERNLGILLFKRMPNRIELSEKGKLYFPIIQQALERIACATNAIKVSQISKILTVQLSVTVAIRWLLPRLHRLEESIPNIQINLDTNHTDRDFNPERADIGLIYTQVPDRQKLSYSFLRREKLVAVCTRDLAKKVTCPADIKKINFLSVAGFEDDIETWFKNVGIAGFSKHAKLFFDSPILAIEAAIGGYGLVIVPEFLILEDLASGKLVMPMQSKVPQSGSWYIVHLESRKDDKNIRKFLSWITHL